MPDIAKRRAAREQAFALLFELSFHPEATIKELLECAAEPSEAGEGSPIKTDPLALRLANKAAENLEKLDEAISERLKGWKLNRISRVAHALLRLALCEMFFFDEIPVGASINEAVELAKRYGDDEAPRFINGVLGAVARQEKTHAEPEQPTEESTSSPAGEPTSSPVGELAAELSDEPSAESLAGAAVESGD